MSVIVKGMEMPKNCKSCPLRYSSTGYAWCDITGASLALEIDMRDYTCPLVEIPTPHGRLGDLDELYKVANMADDFGADTTDILKLIIDTPAVIEAEGETE